jgi:myo-inositol catabolism protein IolC
MIIPPPADYQPDDQAEVREALARHLRTIRDATRKVEALLRVLECQVPDETLQG